MKTQNNRVQGTRHKVSGPLTRDVGPRNMVYRNYRLIFLLLACIMAGCGTNKHNSSNYVPYEWPPPQPATLSTNQIQEIALITAKAHGYDLALYAPPKIYFQPVPGHWSALFGGIAESSGNKSFFVFIDDESRSTSIYELNNQKAQQPLSPR